jgi:tripartite-type tricarboxylate transporter receptor subunit TctC
MAKRILYLSLVVIVVAFFTSLLDPASGQESFYKGKTIRIIVGFSPGGGYDIYSRLIARHIGNHIPGNPTVVIENMAGAGSLISANHVYNLAKPDGLTVGHFNGGLFLQQLLGKPGIEFDTRKFEYIGVPTQDTFVLGLSKASGVSTIEKWMGSKNSVKIGGIGPGSGTYDVPMVLKATLGLPIQLVSGYKGTADIQLAFNNSEIAGLLSSWETFKSIWRKELESGNLQIVLQVVPKGHPELPNVPLAINFATNEDARKLIRAGAYSYATVARPYVLPPSTPKDRVQILRQAFTITMNDRSFLAEAKKATLDINPLSGDELEKTVEGLVELDAPLVKKLKEILK